jgi:hypothetical protein
VSRRASGQTIEGRLFLLGVLVLVPLAGFTILGPMLRVPFDTETSSRYITAFMFQSGSDFEWALTESVPIGIFRPLYGLSFLFDYRIWGGNQFGYHLTDLLLTWGALAMAFILFRRRFGRWTAALAVSLWMLLPAQFHSMFHFYGRNDRLMIYFLLGALLVYDRALGREPGRGRTLRLVLSGIILSMGLLTKESVFYYGIILFAWSLMVLGRGFLRTLKEDWPLWTSIITAAVVYFGIRAALGIRFGDSDELVTGLIYLRNLGQMISWGFPLNQSLSLTWLGAGGITVVLTLPFLRRLPGDVRFGAFCLVAGFLPLPLFWVQRSFLWIPWLFGSLAAAGGMVRFLSWSRRRWGFAGRVLSVLLPIAVLAMAGRWSWLACRFWSHESLVVDQAVTWLVDNYSGPEYRASRIIETQPEFQVVLEQTTMSEIKFWNWVTCLLRIRAECGDAVIVWEEGTAPSGDG